MRGERIFNRAQKRGVAGSSPHARGTPAGCSVGRRSLRFIPACAGNADLLHARSSSLTVHPRMRGERWKSTVSRHSRIGSSPHARGTPAREARVHYQHRFIPACAGNAAYPQFIAHDHRVHPRMRGERTHRHKGIDLYIGSSPHARGTHPRPCRHLCPFRFIPACAGNARALFAAALRAAVHPRMRGERSSPQLMTQWPPGSSPHARGTRTQPRCTLQRGAVHPRMRGERAECIVWVAYGCRFIPACAGNAYPAPATAGSTSVHPRMRGERES